LTRPTGRPRGRPPLHQTPKPPTPEAEGEQTTFPGTGAPGTIEALAHALTLLNAEASRSAPNPAKIRALETSLETQRALLARADSRETDGRIAELARALGDVATYQKTVTTLANEMRILVHEAARKEEELRTLRLEVSSSRPIVERVLREEAAQRAQADANKIAAELTEKKRLASEKAAQERSELEAQVAEIDRRNAMERTRPGPPNIGREGTDLRAAYESRLKHERDIRERIRVLQEEMTQKDAERADPNAEQVRKMSE
jgi:hypothetical protein